MQTTTRTKQKGQQRGIPTRTTTLPPTHTTTRTTMKTTTTWATRETNVYVRTCRASAVDQNSFPDHIGNGIRNIHKSLSTCEKVNTSVFWPRYGI